MARALPAELDVTQHYQQFCAELTQARTVPDAITQCAVLLTGILSPRTCVFMWQTSRGPRQLFPASAVDIPLPTFDELAQLSKGELVLHMDDASDIDVCLAPLRARGELLGWIGLGQPTWSTENRDLLALVAAQAGPLLALLDSLNHEDERVMATRTAR